MSSGKIISLGVIVVYQKPSSSDVLIQNFPNTKIDDFLKEGKRKPIIPDDYKILSLGIGTNVLWDYYVEKYKLVDCEYVL